MVPITLRSFSDLRPDIDFVNWVVSIQLLSLSQVSKKYFLQKKLCVDIGFYVDISGESKYNSELGGVNTVAIALSGRQKIFPCFLFLHTF